MSRFTRRSVLKAGVAAGAIGALLRFAIAQARRGWLEPDDVINARPWREAAKLLKR